jgi:hypothetical protein
MQLHEKVVQQLLRFSAPLLHGSGCPSCAYLCAALQHNCCLQMLLVVSSVWGCLKG